MTTQRTRTAGIDQMNLEAALLEFARDPPPARRRLDRDRGQLPLPLSRPFAQAAHATVRSGSRSARPSRDRAPLSEKQSCEYRFLRTTCSRTSLRDGRRAANLSRPRGPLHYIPELYGLLGPAASCPASRTLRLVLATAPTAKGIPTRKKPTIARIQDWVEH